MATETTGPVVVDDAQLRWGVNNESNNKAYAPQTYNFFSAGLLADPGKGGVTIKQSQWTQSEGATSIEKWDGSTWRAATWAGLSTDSTGVELTSPTGGRFSNHAIVMSGGSGTVDAGAGTAHLSWDADATVLYYSGMSFFHLSDPVLDVAGGRGTLTAVLHGYRSSQSNTGVWEEVPARRVTVADLPSVDLADVLGFVATPAYHGVEVSGVAQATSGADAGSFPQTFVDYLGELGAAAFWYSSGSGTDPYKPALPVTVSYDARAALTAPEPSEGATDTESTAVPEPSASTAPATTTGVREVLAPAGAMPSALTPPAAPVVDEADAVLPRPSTDVRLSAAAPAPDPVLASTDRLWWLGGALLLLAALCLLVPTSARAATDRTTPT